MITRIVALIGLLVTIAPIVGANPLGQVPKDTIISLQRGACERRCAVYKVVVFGDGTAVFFGQYYVKRNGAILLQVPLERISRFLEQVNSAGFFDLRDEYGMTGSERCTGTDDGAPIAIITISAFERAKTVVHHHRCLGAEPDRLSTLEDEVDRMVDVRRFIR